MELWIIAQMLAFGAFLSFSSYMTYRRRTSQTKKFKLKQAILM
ncbi:MAG TPA: hypothetical protein VLH35_02975 [Candidatus Acidoferrales bacterium]|nr:hypothetical protein [Candidatus Acidoferrales bacterium]